jgi:Tfp pilus assembly protein PilF
LYVAAAKAIENNGNVKLAETRFQDALEKKPKEPEVNLEYARFLARHHRLQEAIRYYHVYLKLLPEFKEGEKLSKKFVELPTHAETYNEIGLVLSRGGKLDPAEHWFYLAIQKEPRNKVYRSNLATLLVRKERFPEAVRQFAAVTDQAEAHYNVGYLAANIHHYHIAREQFTLALKMNPDLAEARQWLLYLQSRGRRAEEERIASKYRDEEGIALGWGARGRPSFDHPSLPSEQGFEHRMLAEGHRYGSGHSRMPEQNGHASAQTNPYVQRDASPEYHRRPRRYPSASVALRSDNRREEEQAVDRRQGASSVGQSIRNPYYPAVPSYNNGPLAPRSSTVYP